MNAAREKIGSRTRPAPTGTAGKTECSAAWLTAKLVLLALLALPALSGAPGATVAATPPHVPVPGGIEGKTCYACHIRGRGILLPSEERPRKYSIGSAWVSYLESPHGRLRTMGDPRAPMCEDCHLTREWSYILPREHPQSPIHPDNLGAVCAKCHGKAMLTADVASGSMHFQLRAAALARGKPLAVRFGFLPGVTKAEQAYYLGPFNVAVYVYYFFLALTVATLTFMSAYMVLDLVRRLIERRERMAGLPHEK